MYIKALLGEKNESLMSPARGVTQCFFSSYQVLHKAAAKNVTAQRGKNKKIFLLLLQEPMLLMLLLNCLNQPFTKYLVFKNRKRKSAPFSASGMRRNCPLPFF